MDYLAVLDLDGTLVDTPAAIVATFNAVFADMNIAAPGNAAIRATIGLPLEKAFSDLMGVRPADDLVAHGIGQYQLHSKELILQRAADLIFPHVAAGLDRLRSLGITLAVATSKFQASADALLATAGIRDHFAMVAGADQVKHPKPHPEQGWLILRTLGIPADRAVMVGDTVHDIAMARSAGMRSIAVTYGVHGLPELLSAGPTWIADTFEDVVARLTTVLPMVPNEALL